MVRSIDIKPSSELRDNITFTNRTTSLTTGQHHLQWDNFTFKGTASLTTGQHHLQRDNITYNGTTSHSKGKHHLQPPTLWTTKNSYMTHTAMAVNPCSLLSTEHRQSTRLQHRYLAPGSYGHHLALLSLLQSLLLLITY